MLETENGVDLEFRSRVSTSKVDLELQVWCTEVICRIENVCDLSIYAGCISSCGGYSAVITGVPDFELKIFSTKTGAVIASQRLPDVTESISVSFNPENWRQLCVWDRLYISRLEIEDFVADEVCMLVERRKTIEDVFDGEKVLLSERTAKLWNTDVNNLTLNFEHSTDEMGSISATTWKENLIIFGSSFGSVHTLNAAGEIGPFLTHQEELKNDLTLQVETFIPQVDSVRSLVTTPSNEVIYAGCDGFYRIGVEALRGKKKSQKGMKTIHKIGKALEGDLLGLTPIDGRYYLARSRSGAKLTSQIIDTVTDCSATLSFSHIDSPVLTAVPGPEGTVIVTKENGFVQIHESTLSCLFEAKLEGKIISLVNGPVESVYFAGTESGYLAVVRVERDQFEVIDSSRLFSTPLSSIALDPFGRGLIVGSKEDDKVIALSWSTGARMPKVIGYLPVDGIVSSLSVCSPTPTAPLFVLAAISSASGCLIDACLNFQLSPETMNKGRAVHLNNLLEFEPTTVKAATVRLPGLSSIHLSSCISERLTCFAASPEQNAIRQLDFQLGTDYTAEVDFARSLAKTTTTDISFAAPFHGLWLASLCRSGGLSVTRGINEKAILPAAPTPYAITFNREGDECVATADSIVATIKFEIKTELKTKVKEITKSIKEVSIFNPSALAASDCTELMSLTQREWFHRQLEHAAVQENKKHKPVKDGIESEVGRLREQIMKMISANGAADELEQLDNQEFNLDQEAADQFAHREEDAVDRLRHSVEHQKEQYKAMVETITKSCWSSLETGPRTLSGFNNLVTVSNYQISPGPADQAQELDSFLNRRREQLEEEELKNQQSKKPIQSIPSTDELDKTDEIGISTTGTLSEQLIGHESLLRSQFKVQKRAKNVKKWHF